MRFSLATSATPCLVSASLGVGAIIGSAVDQSVFRSRTDVVAVYATVQDKSGRLAPDLVQADFEILDDGQPVPIRTFSAERVPITATLLLDMSASMAPDLPTIRAAANQLVDNLSTDDRLRIGTFSDEVAISPLLTSDKTVLKRVINEEVWLGGLTPLWAALEAGIASLQAEAGRRVVIVVSDGLNRCAVSAVPSPRSNLPTPELLPCSDSQAVRRAAVDGDAMVYTVGLQRSGIEGGLRHVSEDTGGGYVVLPTAIDLAVAFARIVEELHHQYVFSFTPSVMDGRTHRLSVRSTRAGVRVRAKQSYVAKASK